MHGYKQIDHTADLAIEVWGSSYNSLFKAAAAAWLDLSIEQNDFHPVKSIEVNVIGLSMEELLKEFLSELNHLLHAKKWITCSVSKISITGKEGNFKLAATLKGNLNDLNQFTIKDEIKAVTFHKLKISETDGIYKTKIIFDI